MGKDKWCYLRVVVTCTVTIIKYFLFFPSLKVVSDEANYI